MSQPQHFDVILTCEAWIKEQGDLVMTGDKQYIMMPTSYQNCIRNKAGFQATEVCQSRKSS